MYQAPSLLGDTVPLKDSPHWNLKKGQPTENISLQNFPGP